MMVLDKVVLIFFVDWGDIGFLPFFWKITFRDAIFIDNEEGDAYRIVTHLEDAGCYAVMTVGLVDVEFSDVVNDV